MSEPAERRTGIVLLADALSRLASRPVLVGVLAIVPTAIATAVALGSITLRSDDDNARAALAEQWELAVVASAFLAALGAILVGAICERSIARAALRAASVGTVAAVLAWFMFSLLLLSASPTPVGIGEVFSGLLLGIFGVGATAAAAALGAFACVVAKTSRWTMRARRRSSGSDRLTSTSERAGHGEGLHLSQLSHPLNYPLTLTRSVFRPFRAGNYLRATDAVGQLVFVAREDWFGVTGMSLFADEGENRPLYRIQRERIVNSTEHTIRASDGQGLGTLRRDAISIRGETFRLYDDSAEQIGWIREQERWRNMSGCVAQIIVVILLVWGASVLPLSALGLRPEVLELSFYALIALGLVGTAYALDRLRPKTYLVETLAGGAVLSVRWQPALLSPRFVIERGGTPAPDIERLAIPAIVVAVM